MALVLVVSTLLFFGCGCVLAINVLTTRFLFGFLVCVGDVVSIWLDGCGCFGV